MNRRRVFKTEEGREDPIIVNRKLIRCPTTAQWPVEDMVQECGKCGSYFLHCCNCPITDGNVCHQRRIVFTDGACIRNGQPGAKAGIGFVFGSFSGCKGSVPITDSIDKFSHRSNQQAELLAAAFGLVALTSYLEDCTKRRELDHPEKHAPETVIIATDSEYVVKGITEWLPNWKVIYPTL